MHSFAAIAMRKTLLIAIAALAACGGSSDSGIGARAPRYGDAPQCATTDTCVSATGGNACRQSCVMDGGYACPNGGVCQMWAVCCTTPFCSTALAPVCCADGGC